MTTPNQLLCWRTFLFVVMVCQVTANIIVERPDRRAVMFLMYHNLCTLLTCLVTFLNLIATLHYKTSLSNFELKVQEL